MGRTPTNRGRIGIQPYPVDDLKLQGYVPKTLYVPDDVSVGISILAGKNGDGVRVPQVDDAGNLHTTHSSSTLVYSKNQIHSFIDNTDIIDGYVIPDIWFPDGISFLLYVALVSVDITGDGLNIIGTSIDSRERRYQTFTIGGFSTTDPGKVIFLHLDQDDESHHVDITFNFDNPINTGTIYVDIENLAK